VVGIRRATEGDRISRPHPRLSHLLPSTLALGDGTVAIPRHGCRAIHDAHPVVRISGTVPRHTALADAGQYIDGIGAGIKVYEPHWYDEEDKVGMPSRLLSQATEGWAVVGTEFTRGDVPPSLGFETWLNGERLSHARIGDLAYPAAWLVAYLSVYLTLGPGDLIFMGSPETGHSRPLAEGDVAEAVVQGVAKVRATLLAGPIEEPFSPAGSPSAVRASKSQLERSARWLSSFGS
jgi:2-keto-4-pentenoate hydratase/2-oxohepta-3-ene-1,7-dioic acid hydratase in catechol pathway